MDKLKLLVIDNDPSVMVTLEKYFAEKGFDAFGAADGPDAIERFKKEHPQIVIIDIDMPFSKLDGIETLQQIKEIDKDAICLIFTTIDDEAKVKAAWGLALHYIPKSVPMEKGLDVAVDEAVDIIKKRGGRQNG